MIILDTNVISEMMSSSCDPRVRAWVRERPVQTLYATSPNLAEVLCGLRALPIGRRRADLERIAGAMFSKEFAGRVLPFDAAAADRYSAIVTARKAIGRPIGIFDGLIAAIASVADAPLATRDLRGFDACGLTLINPWSAG